MSTITEFARHRILTSRFTDALTLATHLHAGQVRKGSSTPYIAHLMAVASTVLEFGGDEDEAIGALLHDAAEDCGGRPTLERVRAQFGDRVAEIVEGCTDTFNKPKPDWRPRKEAYLARLRRESDSVKLVAAGDKLHNVNCTLRGFLRERDPIWSRFGRGATTSSGFTKRASRLYPRGAHYPS